MGASTTERDNAHVLGYQGLVCTSQRIASGMSLRDCHGGLKTRGSHPCYCTIVQRTS